MKDYRCRLLGATSETERRITADNPEHAAREYARREFETARSLGREPVESLHVFANHHCYEINPRLETVNEW